MAHSKKDKQSTEAEKPLKPQEQEELRKGQILYEMTQTPGWKVVEEMLENVAYHTWIDPRETEDQEEWVWRELNAYHAANNAKELLEGIQRLIGRSNHLDKVKHGEINRKRMTIR